MRADETLQLLGSEQAKSLMVKLYGEKQAEENTERYRQMVMKFKETYGDRDILMFSSPGRTEISGNHTDHNHGKVLAGSINLDCVGVAARNDSSVVNLVSETFNQKFSIDIKDLEPSERKAGTEDLVRGLLQGFQESGYEIGGFDAYITSNVISSAGVSSSASFEMLLCSMINTFFNHGRMDTVAYSHVGKYAENIYWDKASGLLDQMACAVGGLITIDFKDPAAPVVEKIDFDFSSQGHSLIIVQTGKGHADLSADYSSVPAEMKKVAGGKGSWMELCSLMGKRWRGTEAEIPLLQSLPLSWGSFSWSVPCRNFSALWSLLRGCGTGSSRRSSAWRPPTMTRPTGGCGRDIPAATGCPGSSGWRIWTMTMCITAWTGCWGYNGMAATM